MSAAASRSLLALVLLGLCVRPAAGQEEPPPEWSNTSEASLVMTAGNSESSSFGLRNTLVRRFETSKLQLDAGGIRVESGTVERVAIGTGPGDFVVSERTDRQTTAENYFGQLRYDVDLSDRTYAYGSGGWVRNRFAGVENRWTGAVGYGIKLVTSDRSSFDVDLGVTLASESRVVGETKSFGGLRLTWDYANQLTTSTRFLSKLVMDGNLSDADDLRADFDNAVVVSISEVLALKTGVRMLFDNQPALQEVDLFAAPGGPVSGSVQTPLNELDTQVTVSLVVSL